MKKKVKHLVLFSFLSLFFLEEIRICIAKLILPRQTNLFEDFKEVPYYYIDELEESTEKDTTEV